MSEITENPFARNHYEGQKTREFIWRILFTLMIFATFIYVVSLPKSQAQTERERKAEIAKIEAHERLLKKCQDNPGYSPDQILKGANIPKGSKGCFHMYVFITRYDKQTGRCSFEGRISNKLSNNLHDYSTNSIFGYPTSRQYQINDVKNCPDLDWVDIYDTVSLYAYYDENIRLYRKKVGGGGLFGVSEHCNDYVPLFRIVEVELQTKRVFADIESHVIETLSNNVLSYCD